MVAFLDRNGVELTATNADGSARRDLGARGGEPRFTIEHLRHPE